MTDDVARLRAQALEISELLATAGVGPCPLPEGVRVLWTRCEQAEARGAPEMTALQTHAAQLAAEQGCLGVNVGNCRTGYPTDIPKWCSSCTLAALADGAPTRVSLRNVDTPENRAFWASVDQAVAQWEATRPDWSRPHVCDDTCPANDFHYRTGSAVNP